MVKLPRYTILGIKVKKEEISRNISPLGKSFGLSTATWFSIGATVGVHVYMELNSFVLDLGFYTVFWYLIGGFIAVSLAGCYAELVSLAPCSGGLYSYCYNTVGELFAFLIGWNLILGLSLRFIYNARLLSRFINSNFFEGKFIFFHTQEGTDMGSLYITLFIAGITSTKISESIWINAIIVVLQVIFMVISLLWFIFCAVVDLNKETVVHLSNATIFRRGLHNGFEGFTGFECVVYLGEETLDAATIIPKSMNSAITLGIVCYVFFATFAFFLPTKLDKFEINLTNVIEELPPLYGNARFLGLGGVCSIVACCYAVMMSLVRLIYAMSFDGLLPNILSKVHPRTKSLVQTTVYVAITLGTSQLLLNHAGAIAVVRKLAIFYKHVEYTTVTICLLLTRYRWESKSLSDNQKRWVLINAPTEVEEPTKITFDISKSLISAVFTSVFVMSLSGALLETDGTLFCSCMKWIFLFSLLLVHLFTYFLSRQPQNDRGEQAHMFGVPIIPVCLLAHSLGMISSANAFCLCWATLWTLLGMVFYFIYSRNNSIEAGRVFPNNTDEKWNFMRNPQGINVTKPGPARRPAQFS